MPSFDSNPRTRARRATARQRFAAAAFACAVLRLAPAARASVDADFVAGTLTIASDADDDIVVTCDAGMVKINGNNPDSGPAMCSEIGQIVVNGGPGNNLIDLGGIGEADAPFLFLNVINGGDGDDTIIGTDVLEFLNGDAGNDTITPGQGNDTVNGGDGDDTVIWNSGDGFDLFRGDGDRDTIQVNGGSGADSIVLRQDASSQVEIAVQIPDNITISCEGVEVVELRGGDGDDTLSTQSLAGVLSLEEFIARGEGGNDALNGGGVGSAMVTATLFGGPGDDTLTGTPLNDALDGGADADMFFGNGGNDTIRGGDGDDECVWDLAVGGELDFDGELGDDTLTVQGTDDADTIAVQIVGSGARRGPPLSIPQTNVAYSSSGPTLNSTAVSEAFKATLGPESDIATVSTFNVTEDDFPPSVVINGGFDDDTLDASDSLVGVILRGDGGADLIYGGSGDDSLFGGDGNDELSGGPGVDMLMGEGDDDTLNYFAGDGADTLDGGDGVNDLAVVDLTALANAAVDLASGGAGDATLSHSGADSFMLALDDMERLNVLAGSNDDTVRLASLFAPADLRNISVNLGAGNDTFDGSAASQVGLSTTVDGGDGDDAITGGPDGVVAIGGNGDDTVVVGGGSNNVTGGAGVDTINSANTSGNDSLDGGGDAGDEVILDFGGAPRVLQVFALANDIQFSLESVSHAVRGAFITVKLSELDDMATVFDLSSIPFQYALTIEALGGDDTIDASLDVSTVGLTLRGGDGEDLINGSQGPDVIVGGTGDDDLRGEAGDDFFTWASGDNDDMVNGNAGFDFLTIVDSPDVDTVAINPTAAMTITSRSNATNGEDIVQSTNLEGIAFVSPLGVDETTVNLPDMANSLDMRIDSFEVITADLLFLDLKKIELFHPKFLVINGGSASDTISYQQNLSPSPLALPSLFINGNGGDDIIDLTGLTPPSGSNISLRGGADDDIINGSEGPDTITHGPGDGNDVVQGGGGMDNLVTRTFTTSANGIEWAYSAEFVLAIDSADGNERAVERQTVQSVENVELYGGDLDDAFRGVAVAGISFLVDGGPHVAGDSLEVNTGGASFTHSPGNPGQIDVTGADPIVYQNIEEVSIIDQVLAAMGIVIR